VRTRFFTPWRPLAGLFRFPPPICRRERRTPANAILVFSTRQPGSPPGWIAALRIAVLFC